MTKLDIRLLSSAVRSYFASVKASPLMLLMFSGKMFLLFWSYYGFKRFLAFYKSLLYFHVHARETHFNFANRTFFREEEFIIVTPLLYVGKLICVPYTQQWSMSALIFSEHNETITNSQKKAEELIHSASVYAQPTSISKFEYLVPKKYQNAHIPHRRILVEYAYQYIKIS